MAITTVGPPLAGIRGTIGGVTFSENKAGTYAKIHAVPSNPSTSSQAQARVTLARMGALWAGITQANRNAWDAFAANIAQIQINPLGQNYYLSGFQWFAKCNCRLLATWGGQVSIPPVTGYPAAPTIDAFRVCVSGSESDSATGGTASASSYRVTQEPSKAFDNAITTSWAAADPETSGWIQYTFAAAINITHYRQYFLASVANMMPKSWTFQVFTAGAWTTLQTISNEITTASAWQDYFVVNPYTETQYRLNITANQGHPTALVVMELEFRRGRVGASCLVYHEETWDDPTNTIALARVAMSNSPVRTTQYTGYRQALGDGQIPRRGSSIHAALETCYGTILMQRAWFARIQRVSFEGLSSPITAKTTTTIGG